MTLVAYNTMGLTTEEAQALVAVGQAVVTERDLFNLVGGKYAFAEPERVAKELTNLMRDQKLTRDEKSLLLAAYKSHQMGAHRFTPPVFKNKVTDDGIYTRHPSFACIEQNSISSNMPTFVGSPSMDSSMVGFTFSYAEFYMSRSSFGEPTLSEDAGILALTMAAEQFAGLIRHNASGTPCVIDRLKGDMLDEPPRLINSNNIAEDVKKQAMAICAPLQTAAEQLRDYLSTKDKISTKADYAEAKAMVAKVKDEMLLVVEPLQTLMYNTAGRMAASSQQQLMAEIVEPLLSLGMTPADVMRLTQLK